MAWPAVLERLLGCIPKAQAAGLNGFALRAPEGICFPRLVPGDGGVEGLWLEDPDPETAARLEHLAVGLGYAAQTTEIQVGGEVVAACVFRPDDDRPADGPDWTLADWQARWGGIALSAAEEVMQHYGTVPAETLARMMPMVLVRAAAREAAQDGAPTEIRSALQAGQVEVVAHHNRHAGFFLTREYLLRHPEFDGGLSPEVRREVFVATDAAIVLPYDPVRDRVLLVEQFRMGPFGRGDPHPWMLEPVAGRVDPGEPPETTARRECVEEAGLRLTGLEHISSHYCSPGCSTEHFHCYIGLCDLPDLAQGQGGLDTEHEDIRTHVLPFEHAMGLIPSGEAANGPLVLCLLWLERERDRLRAGA